MQIELSPKQCEFIRLATHRYNGKIGATQCGKTFIDISYVIANRISERKGKQGLNLILGVTKETIERNVLEPMRDFWGSKQIGAINSRNIAILFGEKVYCLGAEKVSQVTKLRGAKFKYAYCDELVDFHPDVFALLKSRLSLAYSICDFTGNPSYPTHPIKEFIDSDVDVYCQQWTLYDNPFLDPIVVKNLEREYKGTVYFDRYVLGLWQKAEGLIYPMYNKAFHVVPTEPRPYEIYYISNDFGVQHPCIFQLWGLANKVWYCIKEYYHEGQKGIQKTSEEYYNDLLKFAEGYPIKRMFLDNAPIASSFNVLVRRKQFFGTQNANNEVLAGIQDVSTALAQGLIKYNDCCTNLIKEKELYSWNEKSATEEPIKENDDSCDCERYFVYSTKIAQPIFKRLS